MKLTISPEEISKVLQTHIEEYQIEVSVDETGEIIEAGDGIARIKGLPNAMASEMLQFEGGIYGMVLNLERDQVGAMILGDFSLIEEGQKVKRTGNVLQVPVGDALVGRVVNPLGLPLDGKVPGRATVYRPLEGPAPSGVERQPVN